MNSCLVDVSNDRGTVLHVFPIAMEGQNGAAKVEDAEQEALKLAVLMQLVPEAEVETLHARPHVSRGGPLMPYGDVVETKRQSRLNGWSSAFANAPISCGSRQAARRTEPMGTGTRHVNSKGATELSSPSYSAL